MKLFLTGATGYLGQQLLNELHRRKHSITALVRSPQRASNFPSDVAVVEGSVEDIPDLENILKQQDIFVHIAALVKMWVRDAAEFDRTNVEFLEKAIRVSSDAGIRKFIYASSFIALGPSNGKPLTEDDPRRTDHFHNHYERTKYLGDQKARELQKEGHPVIILYPGVIYGPGNLTEGNIVAKNIIPFLNGRMPFGMKIKTWTYAFISDVVRGFVRAIEENPASSRYILGGENHSGPSFYEALYHVSGKKPPRLNIPMPVAFAAGYGEYLMAELFGRSPSLLTHEVVRIYKHSWAYDSGLACKELGYKITPLEEGLIEMIGWLKNEGLVR